jgi:glutamate dehydrogenase
MLLNAAGFTIHVTVHPVLKARRDPSGRLTAVLARDSEAEAARDESLIHFEIDRETEPQILADLEKRIRAALRDVRSAVRDWRAMKTKALEVCARLKETPPPLDSANVTESIAFLEWMAEDHFTFLGYRQYRLIRSDDKRLLQAITGTGLGILRRGSRKRPEEFKPGAAEEYRKQSRSGELLVLTKASSRSTVHRPTYLDYVGVKTFDEKGRLSGEHRFLGLYTSTAYSRSPRSIPLLRYKVARVLDESELQPGGHAGKALQHVLETYPRDELFQISTRDLGRIASGILNLQERQRVKLFVRRDEFQRFLSCLVFVPRDRYNTQVRERIEALLMEAFRGRSTEHTVQLADSKLARVHIILWLGDKSPARIDIAKLERRLAAAVRSWEDHLREALIEDAGEEQGIKLAHRYAARFPAAYTEDFSAAQAVSDVTTLDELEQSSEEFILRLGQPEDGDDRRLRLKLFRRGEPIALSDGLPILENMDLKVIAERPYRMRMPDEPIWIQEFEMQYLGNAPLDLDALGARFSDAFARIWAGDAEDDGFNRLILLAGLDWREVAMLRAYCRFLLQTGTPFSATWKRC